MSDKSKTIRVGNITVASGWECKKCGVIRPYNQVKCNCNKNENNNTEIF